MGGNKLWTAESMVTDRAMETLAPLYKEEQPFFDELTGDVKHAFTGPSDVAREELLQGLAREASGIFLKDGSNTYYSVFSSVVVDYYHSGADSAMELFGTDGVVGFYDRNRKSVIDKAFGICERDGMDIYDIPGFDGDLSAGSSDSNKAALVSFVVADELACIKNNMGRFRDTLEKIPKVKKQEASLKPARNKVSNHKMPRDGAELAM